MEDAELRERARQIRNEYMRQYRKKNKEKTKRYNQNYWRRKAALEQKETE